MGKTQSIEELRIAILRYIQHTHNEHLLRRTMDLIEKESPEDKVVGYEADGTPVTRSQLRDSVREAIAEYKAGKYFTMEEMEERMKGWDS